MTTTSSGTVPVTVTTKMWVRVPKRRNLLAHWYLLYLEHLCSATGDLDACGLLNARQPLLRPWRAFLNRLYAASFDHKWVRAEP